MLSLHRRTEAPNRAGTGPVPGDVRYLVSDKAYRSNRSVPLQRVIGNLFILIGVLMLLAMGGWYGFTEWQNQQFLAEMAREFPTPTAQTVGRNEAAPASARMSAVSAAIPTSTPVSMPAISSLNPSSPGVEQAASPKHVDNSPPVRLSLPKVGIDTEVVPVRWDMIPASTGGMRAEWQVADYAVGHHAGSASPGQPGNVVLSGHVDYKGEVFKELHKSNKGDEVVVFTERGQYLYVITDMVLVLEEGASEEQKRSNARYMDPTPDQTLTMITCWPYGVDTHRLIVIAKPYQSAITTQSEFTIR